jgi:hypothetical protein
MCGGFHHRAGRLIRTAFAIGAIIHYGLETHGSDFRHI